MSVTIATYTMVTVFCALFGAIYNLFGHGVYSFFMSFMFLWPLSATLGCLVLALSHLTPTRLSRNILNAGVATITAGSLLKGIFEIAGTSSPYEILFFGTGIALVMMGVVVLIANKVKAG